MCFDNIDELICHWKLISMENNIPWKVNFHRKRPWPNIDFQSRTLTVKHWIPIEVSFSMQSSFNLKSFQGEGAVRRPLRHSLFFALSLAASGKRTFSAPLTFWHRFRYHIVCDTTIYLLRFHSIPHVLRNTSPRRKPFFSTFMGGWLSLLLGGWCCTSKERVCRHETVRFALFRLWERRRKGPLFFMAQIMFPLSEDPF